MNDHPSPPPAARRLLRILFPADVRETRANELDEAFETMACERGRWAARWWYRWQTVLIALHALRLSVPASSTLIRRNAWSALRQLRKNTGFALLNVGGLAIGLAAFMVMVLFAWGEMSWDRFHTDFDRIYRVNRHVIEEGTERSHHAQTAGMLGATMRESFPEVDAVVRIHGVRRNFLTAGEATFRSEFGFISDSTFFEIFDFELLRGRPSTVLSAPFSVVLTESTAERLFGDEDPVGRSVEGGSIALPLTVTGVAADPPENSHLKFDFVISWATTLHPEWVERYANLNNWITLTMGTYVRLVPGATPAQVEARFPEVMRQWLPDRIHRYEFYLQPLGDVHLSGSQVVASLDPTPGNETLVHVLLAVAGLLLAIAVINFVNLATARAEVRALEVGVRKAVGAGRGQLVVQFLGEAIIMSASAMVVAFTILVVALPALSSLSGRPLAIPDGGMPVAVVAIVGITLLTGLAAGFYPAVMLSGFHPSRTLRRITTGSASHGLLRRFLVVTQYASSLVLIIGTVVVYRQMDFMQSRELGYEAEQLVHIPMNDAVIGHFEAFRGELLRDPSILSVTHATGGPVVGAWGMDYRVDGADTEEFLEVRMLGIDQEFFDTYGIDVLDGPDPNTMFDGNSNRIYINETLRDELIGRWGLPDVLGQTIVLDSRNSETAEVAGVVRDFHLRSVTESIPPLVIFGTETGWLATVRVDAARTTEAVAHMENVWKRFEARAPFERIFVDDSFRRFYDGERRLMRILGVFAVLAVVVATLGLFGLTAYMAERRRHEIGIRKVLGATSGNIVMLFTRSFAGLLAASIVVAIPSGFIVARWWLTNFPYRISPEWSVFAASTAIVIVAAGATILFQSVRAARANPVENLSTQ